jgi:hypothetical protein
MKKSKNKRILTHQQKRLMEYFKLQKSQLDQPKYQNDLSLIDLQGIFVPIWNEFDWVEDFDQHRTTYMKIENGWGLAVVESTEPGKPIRSIEMKLFAYGEVLDSFKINRTNI